MMAASFILDDADQRIIRATQSGLPLLPEPYHAIAAEVGLAPGEVMARMRDMLEVGVVRRIAAVPNHYKIGYRNNGMTVWDVPDERVDELGARVGGLRAVSHCYHRPRHPPEWPYNLFAMVHGRCREDVERETRRIAAMLGEHDRGHAILYSTRILKKTGFRIGD